MDSKPNNSFDSTETMSTPTSSVESSPFSSEDFFWQCSSSNSSPFSTEHNQIRNQRSQLDVEGDWWRESLFACHRGLRNIWDDEPVNPLSELSCVDVELFTDLHQTREVYSWSLVGSSTLNLLVAPRLHLGEEHPILPPQKLHAQHQHWASFHSRNRLCL